MPGKKARKNAIGRVLSSNWQPHPVLAGAREGNLGDWGRTPARSVRGVARQGGGGYPMLHVTTPLVLIERYTVEPVFGGHLREWLDTGSTD